jgi:cob(I)alamin adenosyltransferase
VRIYTRRGDDGTTSVGGPGRIPKSDATVEALGALDEAQAALGVARAACDRHGGLADLLVGLERGLWTVMAQVGVALERGRRGSENEVTPAMVAALEAAIDERVGLLGKIDGFAVPGENPLAAALDVARTAVRRAERRLVALDSAPGLVIAYVNRLSDLCWVLARASEDGYLPAREERDRPR